MEISNKPMSITDILAMRYQALVQELNEKLYYYLIAPLNFAEIPKIKLESIYRDDWSFFKDRIKEDYAKLGWSIDEDKDFIKITLQKGYENSTDN